MSISLVYYSNTFADWVTTTNLVINKVNVIDTGDYVKSSGTLTVSVPSAFTSTLDISGRTTYTSNVNFAAGSVNFSNTANVIFSVNTFLNKELTSNNVVKFNNVYANGNVWFGNTTTLNVYNTDLVANLNSQLLGGQNSSFYIAISNTGTTQAQSAFAQANTGVIQAQAAFAVANNEPIAKSAFDKANTGVVQAQAAFAKANTDITGLVSSAFDKANTGVIQAQAAFAAANNEPIAKSAFNQANTGVVQAQAAFDKANTANINAADASFLTTGTIPGDRGISVGSSASSFIEYNGLTKTTGQFYGGSNSPTNTTRLNYDGNLYATTFYGNGTGLSGTASGLSIGGSSSSTTGNAATATALQTARTIGGVSFDGTANINLPGVNTAGNQNTSGSSASCTGNAATATVLQTARSINGIPFNGSADITTANWGTARTLTIGSTGKSVNGSAAVSWSLGEIGAAATNQTMYIGTTAVAINRGTGALSLTGVNIDGTASNITSYTVNQSVGTGNNVQHNSLGIGTGASGTAGEIRATNNITAYYSDDRLKTRLGNIENALDKLCSLDGFYYQANEVAQNLGYESIKEVGVSAQQVQAVLPEIVVPAPIDDQYLTVRYEKLIPLLIEAIKELRIELNELKEDKNG